MNRVDGKVAIVTGAAGGIGSATARLLAKAGARVVATDMRPADGERLVAEIVRDGGQARYVDHDVTRDADWVRVVADTVAREGGLDILVNNAGIYRHGSIEDFRDEDIDALFAVNMKSIVLGTRQAFRAMKLRPKDADSASIVNLSSIAGLVGSPQSSVYSMSKGGVRLFTKAAAMEAAHLRYNIRCNSVHPGIIDTEMARGAENSVAGAMVKRGVAADDIAAMMAASHPLGRMGVAEDIARGILYLASNDSSFMTGSELVIDGGWTAR
ncbi:MAG TPA: glucose 1-dehydrogenase [Quisquiliibacterium sp.]|nr:MAG: glucose 1-dehydrogenase [Burkholderiaceae bacterium]HQN10507.1 glucose 1-dehydrogenase [Quisquiliibacterium sp.]HQP65657.1 glucose 1-dehydrogenase [Quisquiliibacterium sp.]